jgi:hypothetical protein
LGSLPYRPAPLRPNAHHASTISWAALVGRHDQASLVRPTAHGSDRDLPQPPPERSSDRVSGQELRCDRADYRQDGKHGVHSGGDTPESYPRSGRQRGHAGDAHKCLGDDERGNPPRVWPAEPVSGLPGFAGAGSPLEGTAALQMAGRAARETSPRRCARGSVSRGDRS